MAVILRLGADTIYQERGRGFWKLNVSLLQNNAFYDKVTQQWREWTRYQRYFPNLLTWWNRCAKVRIKRTFTVEGATRKRDLKQMKDFLYTAIYAALQTTDDPRTLHIELGILKEKIVLLHPTTAPRYFLDSTDEERQENERQYFTS
jgi:hypothetical protein